MMNNNDADLTAVTAAPGDNDINKPIDKVAEAARIEHYCRESIRYATEYMAALNVNNIENEEDVIIVDTAYQKCKKNCELTLYFIDVLKHTEEGGDSNLNNSYDEMSKVLNRLLVANAMFWDGDESAHLALNNIDEVITYAVHDKVDNIHEMINTAINKCSEYAELMEKVNEGLPKEEKSSDNNDDVKISATDAVGAVPNVGGTELSGVDKAAKLYQEMLVSVNYLHLYVMLELPEYIETSKYFTTDDFDTLKASVVEALHAFDNFKDKYDQEAFDDILQERSVNLLCRKLKHDTKGFYEAERVGVPSYMSSFALPISN